MRRIKKINFIVLLFISLISAGLVNARPLRILFVVGYFPVLPETFIINQITRLLDRGHDVKIFSFNRGNFSKVHSDVHKYQLLKRTYFRRVPRGTKPFDIIYCQFGFQGKRIFRMQRRQKNLRGKVVTCFRGSDISKYLREHPHGYDGLLKQGKLFLPVCEFFEKILIEEGCDPKRIAVHHSAIDCQKFLFRIRTISRNKTLHIISVGRLIQKKGMKYTIRAIALLVKKYPQIRLTIVGDGSQRKSLEQLIKKLHLEKFVTLYGWAIHKEVIRLLDRSHIFVLASNTALSDGNQEGIPNALKEAMAMGLPVVSTHHAGIPELVEDGKSGYLVPQYDPKALAEKIACLIEHPEKWPKMGKIGRKKVEQEFDIDIMIDKLEDHFYQLLGQ